MKSDFFSFCYQVDSRLDGTWDSREKTAAFSFDYCYWSVDPEDPKYASQEMVSDAVLRICAPTPFCPSYSYLLEEIVKLDMKILSICPHLFLMSFVMLLNLQCYCL